jgi:hypothetical protein
MGLACNTPVYYLLWTHCNFNSNHCVGLIHGPWTPGKLDEAVISANGLIPVVIAVLPFVVVIAQATGVAPLALASQSKEGERIYLKG